MDLRHRGRRPIGHSAADADDFGLADAAARRRSLDTDGNANPPIQTGHCHGARIRAGDAAAGTAYGRAANATDALWLSVGWRPSTRSSSRLTAGSRGATAPVGPAAAPDPVFAGTAGRGAPVPAVDGGRSHRPLSGQ
jgi:hypothetical protein